MVDIIRQYKSLSVAQKDIKSITSSGTINANARQRLLQVSGYKVTVGGYLYVYGDASIQNDVVYYIINGEETFSLTVAGYNLITESYKEHFPLFIVTYDTTYNNYVFGFKSGVGYSDTLWIEYEEKSGISKSYVLVYLYEEI